MVLWALGLSVFRDLCADGGDVVVSPMSIGSCLWMAAAGTTDGSIAQKEFNSVLGTTAPELTSGGSVDIANSVWIHASVKSDYITEMGAWGAEVRTLESTDPAPINAWVNNKTHGIIKSLLDDLDSSTVLVLVNTVFFKGMWEHRFPRYNTKDGSFRSFDRNISCKMMYNEFNEEESEYVETRHAQMARLPYQRDDMVATIILPFEEGRSPLQDTITSLTPEVLSDLQWEDRSVNLHLPRFKIEFKAELSPRLTKLGLQAAFNGDGGFQKMSDDPTLHISKVAHQVVLSVDEKGTVGAAATGSSVVNENAFMPDKEPVSMKVDRPFIFMVSDRKGSIFFIGQALSPDSSVISSDLPTPVADKSASKKDAFDGARSGVLHVAAAISVACFVLICAIMCATKNWFSRWLFNSSSAFSKSSHGNVDGNSLREAVDDKTLGGCHGSFSVHTPGQARVEIEMSSPKA